MDEGSPFVVGNAAGATLVFFIDHTALGFMVSTAEGAVRFECTVGLGVAKVKAPKHCNGAWSYFLAQILL